MSALDPQRVGLEKEADLKKELDATLRARGELGAEYDSALVDSFLEKVEQRIGESVDRRVRRHLAEQQMATARGGRGPRPADSWADRYGFALLTLVLAIPLSAIAAVEGLPGMVTAWLGIVGVNLAQAARLNPEIFRARQDRSAEQD
ncbi:hypothetical protein [Streptomyces sp. NPDC002671]